MKLTHYPNSQAAREKLTALGFHLVSQPAQPKRHICALVVGPYERPGCFIDAAHGLRKEPTAGEVLTELEGNTSALEAEVFDLAGYLAARSA